VLGRWYSDGTFSECFFANDYRFSLAVVNEMMVPAAFRERRLVSLGVCDRRRALVGSGGRRSASGLFDESHHCVAGGFDACWYVLACFFCFYEVVWVAVAVCEFMRVSVSEGLPNQQTTRNLPAHISILLDFSSRTYAVRWQVYVATALQLLRCWPWLKLDGTSRFVNVSTMAFLGVFAFVPPQRRHGRQPLAVPIYAVCCKVAKKLL
jgi:hypothetical protein